MYVYIYIYIYIYMYIYIYIYIYVYIYIPPIQQGYKDNIQLSKLRQVICKIPLTITQEVPSQTLN